MYTAGPTVLVFARVFGVSNRRTPVSVCSKTRFSLAGGQICLRGWLVSRQPRWLSTHIAFAFWANPRPVGWGSTIHTSDPPVGDPPVTARMYQVHRRTPNWGVAPAPSPFGSSSGFRFRSRVMGSGGPAVRVGRVSDLCRCRGRSGYLAFVPVGTRGPVRPARGRLPLS